MRKKNMKPDDRLNTEESAVVSRRKFLGILGAAGITSAVASALAWPLGKHRAQASGPQQHGGIESEHHWIMVIDLSLCIGCQYCVYACQAINDVPDEMRWNVYMLDKVATGEPFHMTRPCLHCQNAPCANVCPVGATYQRGDGLVVMDYERCIGCRYCMVACPYDVRRFNWSARTDENHYEPQWGSAEVERRPRGVVEKCTFCIHRVDLGLEYDLIPGEHRSATPACCNICPVGARKFGDLNDPRSEVAQIVASTPTFRLREELGTEPNVYYVPAEGMVIE
jgi:molybdopterin-containing oxidoreductase family iron-sulfur binding subunit